MKRLIVKTQKKKEIIDITNDIQKEIRIGEGICSISVLHTTAALTLADLDPGTDLDMLDAFEAMMPRLAYRHPHNPAHVTDHIMSSIIGASITIPISENHLVLGSWQRVVLVELDGPRTREIVITTLESK